MMSPSATAAPRMADRLASNTFTNDGAHSCCRPRSHAWTFDEAKQLDTEAAEHRAKVDELRGQLEEVDECGDERAPAARTRDGGPTAWRSRTFGLEGRVRDLAERATTLRKAAQTATDA